MTFQHMQCFLNHSSKPDPWRLHFKTEQQCPARQARTPRVPGYRGPGIPATKARQSRVMGVRV